jgi:spermine oxidase
MSRVVESWPECRIVRLFKAIKNPKNVLLLAPPNSLAIVLCFFWFTPSSLSSSCSCDLEWLIADIPRQPRHGPRRVLPRRPPRRGAPAGTVRLGLRLRRLDWGRPPARLHFAEGAPAFAADHIIVTVSLGVLKASLLGKQDATASGAIAFDPPLPPSKREAVALLGFGVVNKLFMEVEPVAEAPAGPEAGEQPLRFPFLHMAFCRGDVASKSKITWWMRGTESICPVHDGSRVALAWFAGREAEHLERLPDDEVILKVNATLDSFLPASSLRWRVKRVKRSGWATDPLFLGSYSYVAVGSSGEDLDRMAEPLPPPATTTDGRDEPLRVLFAGEATHRTHYSTTNAAYISGVREADRLLQHYR